MGWSGGSIHAQEVALALKREKLPMEVRKRVLRALVESLEDDDWDTQDDAYGVDKALDAVLDEDD